MWSCCSRINGPRRRWMCLRRCPTPKTDCAAVGYKWYDSRQRQPLFPFGHGLTYTRFAYTGLKVASNDGTVTATFDVKNVGAAEGKEVAQVYVGHAGGGWEAPKRLA